MALVIFESQVNMLTVATPSVGGFVVAYDLDGKLKQKDSNGLITLVGATGVAGPLVDTLAVGNNSGTYSIVMGNNTAIKSAVGTASIKLDNSFIRLSTDGDSYQESFVTISPTQVNLSAKGGSSSLLLGDNIQLSYRNTDNIYLTKDLFYVTLNGRKVMNFTTSTASQPAGSKISGVISSEQSYFSTTTTNSVILGGTNIVGTQSNSVYVANILSQGPIKGIDGSAQLDFTQYNETFLSSSNYIIGLVSSSASLAPYKNGILMVDNLNSFTTPAVNTGVSYISSANSTNSAGLINTVVIGGAGLSATQSNTVYLGNNVNVNNAYNLPTTDGSANQVIITDGMGNLSWGSSVSNQVVTRTAASFSALTQYMANTTYRITNADSSLYGGTEIYLSTNASGVLNDKGVGKFYNPKYNQAITGYGIWSPSGTYATNSTAIWGGYLWVNNNGTNLSAVDQFTLNPASWTVVPYNNINYNISYDEIKYDVTNNRITYRNERNTNIVNTSYDKILTASYSAIKSFQWGNLYNTTTQKGVGSIKVDGIYINIINATGSMYNKNYINNTVVSSIDTSSFRLDNNTQNSGYVLVSDSSGIGSWTYSNYLIAGSQGFVPYFVGDNLISNSILRISNFGRTLVITGQGAPSNPLPLLSSLSYLSVQRTQTQIDLILGNPDVDETSIDIYNRFQYNSIISDNNNGFFISSKGPIAFNVGPSSSSVNITNPSIIIESNRISIKSLPVYTNNSDAIANGLTSSNIYKTTSGNLMIVI